MNQYTKLLNNSLREIDEFFKTEKGKEWDIEWYTRIKTLIVKAAQETNQGQAEKLLDMILWTIVDSGPLGFAPSLDHAQEMLVKVNRQREISKHKKA